MPKTTNEKIPFTNTSVDDLKPRDKSYRVWEQKQQGLYVLVSPKGTKTYYLSYTVPGCNQRKDFKLGRHGAITPSDAKRMAKASLGEVAKGIDIQASRNASRRQAELEKSSTLGAFIEQRYKPWALTHKKKGEEDLKRVERHFGKWFDLPLSEISIRRLTLFQTEQLKKGRKASGINRDVNCIRGILSKAVDFELLEETPLRKLKNLPVDKNKRVRYLSIDEEQRLRIALDNYDDEQRNKRARYNQWLLERRRPNIPELTGTFACHVKPVVLIALNTGLRITEVLELNWNQVNINQRLLTVIGDRAKNGQTRHIHLTDEAHYAFREWRKQNMETKVIFPNKKTGKPMKDIKSSWTKIRKEAGLYQPKEEDLHFRFHDLRRSFASNMVMAGVDLNHVRDAMGHQSIDMTLKYAHLAPQSRQSAIAVLNDYMKASRQAMDEGVSEISNEPEQEKSEIA